jgi:hypothetical protein
MGVARLGDLFGEAARGAGQRTAEGGVDPHTRRDGQRHQHGHLGDAVAQLLAPGSRLRLDEPSREEEPDGPEGEAPDGGEGDMDAEDPHHRDPQQEQQSAGDALAVEGPAGLAPHRQVRLEVVGRPAHPGPQTGRRIAHGLDESVPAGRPHGTTDGGQVLGEGRCAADEQHPGAGGETEPAKDQEGDHRWPPQLRPCRPRPRRAMAQ